MCRAHQENSTKLNQPPTVDVYIGTKQKKCCRGVGVRYGA